MFLKTVLIEDLKRQVAKEVSKSRNVKFQLWLFANREHDKTDTDFLFF
jgi:hypothetical protein